MRSLLVTLTLGLMAVSGTLAAQDDKAEVDSKLKPLLEKFVSTVDGLDGYSVTMTKQQRIGGSLKPAETVFMKHRRSPECRYMKWLEEPHKDREVILCKDRDDGDMLVHQPGTFGFTMSLSPTNSIVTSGNLRPISQSGIFNMALLLKAQAQKRQAGGEAASEPLPKLSERTFNGQPALCLHRDQGAADDKAPYKVGATELCFDKTTAMPLDVQFWDTGGQLMEHYSFRDYNLKPALTDKDFDSKNPEYHF